MGQCSGKQKNKTFRGEPIEKKKSKRSFKYSLKTQQSEKTADKDFNKNRDCQADQGERQTHATEEKLVPVKTEIDNVSLPNLYTDEANEEKKTKDDDCHATGTLSPSPHKEKVRKEVGTDDTKHVNSRNVQENNGNSRSREKTDLVLKNEVNSIAATALLATTESLFEIKSSTIDSSSIGCSEEKRICSSGKIAENISNIANTESNSKAKNENQNVINSVKAVNSSTTKTDSSKKEQTVHDCPIINKPYNFSRGSFGQPKEVILHQNESNPTPQPHQIDLTNHSSSNNSSQESAAEVSKSVPNGNSQLSEDDHLTFPKGVYEQPTFASNSNQNVNRLKNIHPTEELGEHTSRSPETVPKELGHSANGQTLGSSTDNSRQPNPQPTNEKRSSRNTNLVNENQLHDEKRHNSDQQHQPQAANGSSPEGNKNQLNQQEQGGFDAPPASGQTGYEQSRYAKPVGDVRDLNPNPEPIPQNPSTTTSEGKSRSKNQTIINIGKSGKKKKRSKNDSTQQVHVAYQYNFDNLPSVSSLSIGCTYGKGSKTVRKVQKAEKDSVNRDFLDIGCDFYGELTTDIKYTNPPELPEPVIDSNTIQLLAKAIDSVGIVKGKSVQGTCGRIGKDFIFTAWHVIRSHIVYYTRGLENLNEIELRSIKIIFGQTTAKDKWDESKAFEVETYVPYYNESLDVAILKLKPNGKAHFPPPFKHFHNLDPGRDGNREVYLIGHPNELQKVNYKVGSWNPTEERMKLIQKFCIDEKYEFGGYAELDKPDKLVVKCEFRHGASGCPGFIILDDGFFYVVTIFLRGFPDFYYEKNFESKRAAFPKEKLFQQGVKIGAFLNDLQTKNPVLYKEMFEDNSIQVESSERNRLAVSGDPNRGISKIAQNRLPEEPEQFLPVNNTENSKSGGPHGHMTNPTNDATTRQHSTNNLPNISSSTQPILDAHLNHTTNQSGVSPTRQPNMLQRQSSQMAVTGREQNIPLPNIDNDDKSNQDVGYNPTAV